MQIEINREICKKLYKDIYIYRERDRDKYRELKRERERVTRQAKIGQEI